MCDLGENLYHDTFFVNSLKVYELKSTKIHVDYVFIDFLLEFITLLLLGLSSIHNLIFFNKNRNLISTLPGL